jgi:TRAP-type C4-dicarboxylate transport system permease small subunit
MFFKKIVRFLDYLMQPIIRVLLIIGISVLAVMMFLMAADVILRYLFNSPLPGAYELFEYMMAIIVSFGIVYCAHRRGHVTVDLVVDRFPKKVQAVIGSITSFFSLGLFILITWQNLWYIKEQFGSRLTSAVLLIPVYPFVAVVAIGFGAFCIVLLKDFINFLSGTVAK